MGRATELAQLDAAVAGGKDSVVALVGPGGQGKTAIVQHWLASLQPSNHQLDGLFLWSFYRGKNSDLCLRELYTYAEGHTQSTDASATYYVDRLLPRLRRERWAIVLDGLEVVQHESGLGETWAGRLLHPDLARLIEELATEPQPGVLVLTTRFAMPGLSLRRHARVLSLATLEPAEGLALMRGFGVTGEDAECEAAAAACGLHAKAVELLGTLLARNHRGDITRWREVLGGDIERLQDDELRVARVLAVHHATLPPEMRDILALATAYHEPPTEANLVQYLLSPAVASLLETKWLRTYPPFPSRGAAWLRGCIDELVELRLLERVHSGLGEALGEALGDPLGDPLGDAVPDPVIDAHPLVRRAFEHTLGVAGRRQSSLARGGFLRGRPNRRRPDSLEEAREHVELFHAHCEAELWNEADDIYVELENPKHRLLAPAFERELLLCFFPHGDWRQPPLWPGFGRYRSLAIASELLGDWESALELYRGADAPLRGDALIAMGRLEPLLGDTSVPQPWQCLWQAYRAHALCLAGRIQEAVRLAEALIPVDIYEWVHVFECLLRAGRLDLLSEASLQGIVIDAEHRWASLTRQRLLADFHRVRLHDLNTVETTYRELLEAYDRGGLPWERTLTRLSLGQLCMNQGRRADCISMVRQAIEISRRYGMPILELDGQELLAEAECRTAETTAARARIGYRGPTRA